MPIPRENTLISSDDYLEGEKHSEIKHEYIAGHVYAMVGTSVAHNRITVNLASALNVHLRGSPCRVFMADLKVRVEKADVFYYPDIVVSCQNADIQPSAHYIAYPTLIIEVLSPSTERLDREEKLHNYQTLESLQEYLLVAQEKMEVQAYRRTPSGWEAETYSQGDQLKLSAVGLELPIESIYLEVWE